MAAQVGRAEDTGVWGEVWRSLTPRPPISTPANERGVDTGRRRAVVGPGQSVAETQPGAQTKHIYKWRWLVEWEGLSPWYGYSWHNMRSSLTASPKSQRLIFKLQDNSICSTLPFGPIRRANMRVIFSWQRGATFYSNVIHGQCFRKNHSS